MATPLTFQSLGTRVAILLCFWSAILFSIPSWLRLTTIQRLPLPAREVESLGVKGRCPLTLQSSLNVLVDAALIPASAQEEERSFLGQVEQLVKQSLALKAESPTAGSLECTRWNVAVHAISVEKESGERVEPETGKYAVYVTGSDNAKSTTTRIPTVHLTPDAEDSSSALPLVPDTVSAAVIAELLHLRGDDSFPHDEASSPAEQDPRVIQYSKHIRLVFSIMNQDVTDNTAAYDSYLIHALANNASGILGGEGLDPIGRLRKELKGLHDFHVETQVQWFAPLAFQPTMEVLEEIVEREVEEEVMVDEMIEEEVEVEIEIEDEDEDEKSSEETFVDAVSSPNDTADAAKDEIAEGEEAEVEAQLDSPPPTRKRRTRLVKRPRTIQVPSLQRTTKQTRTPLPPRHVIEWDDLKVFVNSEEWALTSTVPPTCPSSSTANVDEGMVGPSTSCLRRTIFISSSTFQVAAFRRYSYVILQQVECTEQTKKVRREVQMHG